jgi:hypothetical protein
VVIDRLLKLESDAAHVTACVSEAAAFMARQKTDSAQAVLSAVKIWLALLPDDARLELRAARPGAEDPGLRLGVRVCLPVSRAERPRPVDSPASVRGSPVEALSGLGVNPCSPPRQTLPAGLLWRYPHGYPCRR